MNQILIVVDMQNDFVNGSLGTPEAKSIVPAVQDKIKHFDGKIIFTKDTHKPNYLNTQEGRRLPVEHCIKGTPGHEIIDDLKEYAESAFTVFEKGTFGSRKLARFLRAYHKKKPIDSIELVGLCTDICVVSNALLLKAFLPEVLIRVDSRCCAGVTPESHLHALKVMESCQIQVN